MDYASSGVDINLGNKVKSNIKNISKRATRPEVLSKIGGFGGLFKLDTSKYQNPVLVSSTDGVGSKIKLAFQYPEHHSTVAQDLVNHCVNDIIVTGAEPLFFLDYIGMNKLKESTFESLIRGFSLACEQNNCALIGGETAQLPDLYSENEYDLSGTIVGVVEENEIINGNDVKHGDSILGILCSGLQTNGYTLARKVLKDCKNQTIISLLMQIHQSFLAPFNVCRKYIKAAAHITGGGLIDNIPRSIPGDMKVIIKKDSWEKPYIFTKIQEDGNIEESEMYKVFNMGIGMTFIVDPLNKQYCLEAINNCGYFAKEIGIIEKATNQVTLI